MSLKGVAFLILLIPALAISYYFAIALPRTETAKLEFEKSKYEAEKAERQKHEAREGNEATDRKYAFQRCVREATDRYWKYLDLNSTPAPEKPGAMVTPQRITDSADKHKKDDVEECHRLHDK